MTKLQNKKSNEKKDNSNQYKNKRQINNDYQIAKVKIKIITLILCNQ